MPLNTGTDYEAEDDEGLMAMMVVVLVRWQVALNTCANVATPQRKPHTAMCSVAM
jgi:hypothetical protein